MQNTKNADGLERERQVVAVPLRGAAADAVNPRGASLAEVALSLRAPVHKLQPDQAKTVLADVGLRASPADGDGPWFDRAELAQVAARADIRERVALAAVRRVPELGHVGGGRVSVAR